MIEIKDASQDDISKIIEIAEKTWWPTYTPFIEREQIRYMLDAIYSPATIRDEMLSGRQQFLILYDNGLPRGFASYGRRPEDPATVKLHKLYVLPEKHSSGYGRALINEIRSRLEREGFQFLDLNVNRNNPARGFYERVGFKVIREEDIPIGPYWMNDFVMRMEVRR